MYWFRSVSGNAQQPARGRLRARRQWEAASLHLGPPAGHPRTGTEEFLSQFCMTNIFEFFGFSTSRQPSTKKSVHTSVHVSNLSTLILFFSRSRNWYELMQRLIMSVLHHLQNWKAQKYSQAVHGKRLWTLLKWPLFQFMPMIYSNLRCCRLRISRLEETVWTSFIKIFGNRAFLFMFEIAPIFLNKINAERSTQIH